MTMLETVLKLASVATAIFPLVLSESFRLPIEVLTDIAVAICEEVAAVALSEALMPLTFVFVAVGEHVHAVTLGFAVDPLANIGLTISALPDAVSVLDTLQPLSVVHLAILPLIDALAIGFALLISAMIAVARREDFVAPPVSLVLKPFALVDAPILVYQDTEAFSLSLWIELATIDAVFVLLDAKFAILSDLLEVKLIADHLILLDCVAVILKLAFMLARRSKAFLEHLIQDGLGHLRVTMHDTIQRLVDHTCGLCCQLGH